MDLKRPTLSYEKDLQKEGEKKTTVPICPLIGMTMHSSFPLENK